jgi:hypothetical protein
LQRSQRAKRPLWRFKNPAGEQSSDAPWQHRPALSLYEQALQCTLTMDVSSNESWVVEAGGDAVEKLAKQGQNALSSTEALLYWLWKADYMMRNAGDFANAVVLEKNFQREIVLHAKELGFAYTQATFSLPRHELEAQYFDRFEAVCDEIRGAQRQ